MNFGDQCFIVTDQRGFASVLQCIANFDHQNKILTSTVVTSIDWNDECVCAEVMGQGRMCGDYGIVTFSIGVLQNWIASNKFNGSLSTEKMKAITNSKMGLYLKIFIKFQIRNDDVFWDTSASYTYATNTERGYYPVLQPIGASLPGSPPIVLMTLTGDEAKRISDLGSNGKDKVREEVVDVLRKWYNIQDERLLTITNDDIEYYDWNTDEFFLGMFSNNPTTLTINDKRNLAMPEGRLYFSGEANNIEHGGTIHGAYCSGMDAATKILTAKGMYNEASNSLPKCSTSSGCSQESSKKQNCPPSGTTPPTVPSSAKGWYVSTFTLASILLAVLLVCGA
ncbi:PREDICTED: polyamine oxidase-like [Amphimedon queenslandica]|nr:PREDICTED: polyamine oxidase-like [Amphimedon queenslandica]|eukprot:XP_011406328.1 PREDICTED: polyamine oxidase-like [Amphimedon queenslandica]